jgi:hypothetical protein
VGEGQSVYSMGLVQREVRILAQRATTQNKGLFILLNHHTCANNSLYILYICFLSHSYFSSLQVKNIPCEGVTKHAFILGPVVLIVNNCSSHKKVRSIKIW